MGRDSNAPAPRVNASCVEDFCRIGRIFEQGCDANEHALQSFFSLEHLAE
jgi:hypothetical protein